MNEMVSVIVPVYNMGDYLKRCLKSILNQTYHNMEIIIVNDGSTDNSQMICETTAQLDKRVRVFNKKNGGISSARNCGLKNVNGQYISFVDPDDWIEPDFIEKLYRNMQEKNSDISICTFQSVFQDGRVESACVFQEDRVMEGEEALILLFQNREIDNHLWNKLYKRELFGGILFPEGKIYEDIHVLYKVFMNAHCVSYITNSLYHYTKRAHSISNTHDMDSERACFSAFCERYFRIQVECPEYTKYAFEDIFGRIRFELNYFCNNMGFIEFFKSKFILEEFKRQHDFYCRELKNSGYLSTVTSWKERMLIWVFFYFPQFFFVLYFLKNR